MGKNSPMGSVNDTAFFSTSRELRIISDEYERVASQVRRT